MGLLRSSRPKARQLLFVTDLHGSTIAFRKLLSAPSVYGVEALVCGGDVAGKRLTPLVNEGGGGYPLAPLGPPPSFAGAAALAEARASLEARGAYPILVDADEL